MKRNLFLFALSLFLGVFIYWTQEVPDQKKWTSSELKNHLIDTKLYGALKSFSNAKVKIVFSQQGAFLEQKQTHVRESRVNEFFKRMGHLKIIKNLKGEEIRKRERDFFSSSEMVFLFEFERKVVKLTLGDKTQFSRSFYVKKEIGDQVSYFLVKDMKPLNKALMKQSAHRDGTSYREIKTLFYLGEKFFENRFIFRTWSGKENPILQLSLENKHNRSWSVKLAKRTSAPKAPKGLDLKQIKNYQSRMASLEGEALFKKGKLGNLLATLKIKTNEREAILTLYDSLEGKEGPFLKSDLDQYIYKLSKEDRDLFFTPIQSLWNLTPIKEPALGRLVINWGSGWETFQFDEKERFKVKHQKGVHKAFFELKQLITSRGNYYLEDKEQIATFDSVLKFKHKDKLMEIKRRGDDLLIVDSDLKGGFVYTKSSQKGFKRERFFHE